MASLSQMDKVVAMKAEGWEIVPRAKSEMKLGGPVLMTRGGKYIFVYASSELTEPTPDEIAGW